MSKALGSKYNIESSEEIREYYEFVRDLLESDVVNEMKNFRHHYSTTCFQHCMNVSYYSYLVCRKLDLNAKDAARAGMLHDMFLYDRRAVKKKQGEKPHNLRHPAIALENAKQYFEIDKLEEDIIVKHMWPLTIRLPRYAESYVTCAVDKYIATLEFSAYVLSLIKVRSKEKKFSYQAMQ